MCLSERFEPLPIAGNVTQNVRRNFIAIESLPCITYDTQYDSDRDSHTPSPGMFTIRQETCISLIATTSSSITIALFLSNQ